MRNIMIFIAILIVGVFAYQMAAPYLEEMGIDMNVTAVDAVDEQDVENHN